MDYSKLAGILTIWIISLVGGLLPACVKERAPRITSLLNIATGGVFMAAGLIDLLPDSVDTLQSYMDRTGIPLSYLCCGAAFIAVFVVEELAEYIAKQNGLSHPLYSEITDPSVRQSSLEIELTGEVNRRRLNSHHDHSECKHATPFHAAENGPLKASVRADCDDPPVNERVSPTQALIVLLALSFHSVMEGLGLGAAPDKDLFGIFIAIMGHKWLAAFSLGSIIYKSCTPGAFASLMTVFSLATPVGAICGMLLVNQNEGSVAQGVCTALAAGTFLHVAAMEVIPQELHNNRHGERRYLKLLSMVIGFVAFTCLVLVTG
mmetsp:Transcript_41729/g.65308  ORF Transcript_41729/g.65308 Transcript_41729/m.65308 type:complete len:320 (+) Transcript_41729:147-1106(+)